MKEAIGNWVVFLFWAALFFIVLSSASPMPQDISGVSAGTKPW